MAKKEKRWEIVQGEAMDLLVGLEDESVGAVVTDPPYSSGGAFRGDRIAKTSSKYQITGTRREYPEFDGDTRDGRAYLAWSILWVAQCWRACRPSSPICIFSDWRQLATTIDALQGGGFVFRGIVPWDKISCRPSMGRFAAQCEYVVWGSKGSMPTDRGVGCLPGVIRATNKTGDKLHLTGKPIETMTQVVEISEPDSLILDPFTGSGSTGVAALMTGRRFLGFEMSEEYWQIASERMKKTEVRTAGQWSKKAQAKNRLMRSIRQGVGR